MIEVEAPFYKVELLILFIVALGLVVAGYILNSVALQVAALIGYAAGVISHVR